MRYSCAVDDLLRCDSVSSFVVSRVVSSILTIIFGLLGVWIVRLTCGTPSLRLMCVILSTIYAHSDQC